MSLPEYIEALNAPTGNNVPYGIIEQIRGNVTNSNILSYVVPTFNGSQNTYGNINNPIIQNGFWQSWDSSGYFQVEFRNRYVFPTHYSLKSSKGWDSSTYWNLYGFNSGDQVHTLLSNDTCINSTYTRGQTDEWGTFAIKYPPNKAFRYFRITHPTHTYFALSGIEFFGFLSTNGITQHVPTPTVTKNKLNCHTCIPVYFKLQTSLFLIVITLLS
jgi:hypothetical protein